MITPVLAYTPFFDPFPIWVRPWIWPLLLMPLCLAVSVVYKSIRCRQMSQVPRESAVLFITIILGMMLTALALAGIVSVIQ